MRGILDLLAATIAPLSLASLLLLTAGCKPAANPSPTADSLAQRGLTIGPENFAVVIEGDIQTGPAISGTLAPRQKATMRAQIAGAVLQSYVEQGQHVSAGTVLVRLDDRAIRDGVTSARASVTNAKSSLEVTRRDEARLTELLKVGAIAERDVDNARRNTIGAQTALSQAQTQLVSAQKQLAFTQVRAPFSGIVSEKLVNTGDIVQPGGALYTIVEPSSMQLEASIPADQLSLVKIGSPVQFTVTGYPNQAFNGRITRINPSADPATRQVRIYAEIPNSGGVLVGDLFAQGRVASQTRRTMTVPNSAIDRRSIRPIALRLNGGKVERIEISLGLRDEKTDRIEILSGVHVGDTLLTGPAQQIAPGTIVHTTKPSQSTAAQGGSAR